MPSVATSPRAQPPAHHCTRGCLGSTGHPACGPSGRRVWGPRGSAPRRQDPRVAGSLPGCAAGYLAHLAVVLLVVGGVLWDLGHRRVQSLPQADPRAQGLWGSGAVASRPLVPEEAHHWGTQLGTPGAEEGRVGATGGPRTPQGSPVTSAETRVPSASRTQTQACAVRLPGKGKERVVSHRALCGWPVPTSPGDLLPPLGPETSQPRVSSVYDESGKDNGEMQ